MSLRLRIAGVAGLAVAITVVAVAAIVYVAIRSELRSEVDRSLQSTAQQLVREPDGGRGGPSGGPVRPRPGGEGGAGVERPNGFRLIRPHPACPGPPPW